MPRSEPYLLSTAPADPRQKRVVAWTIGGLLAVAVLTAPVARIELGGTESLLPAYATAVLINDLLTAALLLVICSVSGTRAVLVLALGYLFTGLLVVPWGLTFPGVFPVPGPLNAGIQSTAWIAAVRRLTFPCFVLAYALLRDDDSSGTEERRPSARTLLASVAATTAAAVLTTWLIVAAEGSLPRFMSDTRQTTGLWISIPVAAVAICCAALSLLIRRCRSALDLWLMVVLATFLIELLLMSFLSAGRFSLGWWAGRIYGLLSASIVLVALLAQTAALHAQLARSVAAERRAREVQLVNMEALSASIAHEVNQPLASMVTNADAGIRWLDKPVPDLDEVRAALRRIAGDGHRAGRVVESIRAMVKREPQLRVPVDIGRLVEEAIASVQDEAQLARVRIEADLDRRSPAVIANPVQLRQAIVNLITNGIQAMASVPVQDRILHVSSGGRSSGGVLVSVEDAGTGLAPGLKEKIFEPFFTTKSHGMGLGLMFCRSVVEAHGGRLWVADRRPRGAIFQLELPGMEDSVTSSDPLPTAAPRK